MSGLIKKLLQMDNFNDRKAGAFRGVQGVWTPLLTPVFDKMQASRPSRSV